MIATKIIQNYKFNPLYKIKLLRTGIFIYENDAVILLVKYLIKFNIPIKK